jgi:hypothetical protein
MRVLIISDTHDNRRCITRIHEVVSDIDMLIHLGDVGRDADYIRSLFDCEIHMVAGNNDYGLDLPQYDEFYIGDHKTFITHGHRYGVGYSTRNLESLIDEEDYKFVMYGHTHVRDLTRYGDSYIVNPGSLSLPRDNRVGTYMILDFDQHGTPFFAQNELPRAETSDERRSFWEKLWGD